jgi:hypothetical protein
MYTDHLLKLVLKNLFDSNIIIFINYSKLFQFCRLIKTTSKASISSMDEHFTTYKHHNHHHYYNIMYHQRFIFNLNLNFMILSQLEKELMKNYSLYIYSLMCNFF